jgi:phosphoribosylformylglycinamidine synthase subunit PurL
MGTLEGQVEITPEMVAEHGFTPEEYDRVLKILGRSPTIVELGVFSVMWSEHCSYKSSRVHLAKLPNKGKQVICGPGENAGIVDIGEGLALVFKMESHNHPSFIEPYQGAATGVGGILRDVFTMGARPIALLNSLRFGAHNHPKTKHLINGVVAGIAGYGNCVGIPTVGGEVYFDNSYNGNILVNAMCVGLVEKDKIFLATAGGIGNPVFYVGSKTGRDGIHGATMASDVFDDESESKRPTVQVGDPFTEKLLLEACLELMQTKDVVGIQDMGAAGLTCSTLEMADKGNVGVNLDLNKVPCREEKMTAYELMLSESQERMLFVAKKGSESRIKKIFKKWDLDAAVVGQVVKGDTVNVSYQGKLVGVIPTKPITDKAPKYNRPVKKPTYLKETETFDTKKLPIPTGWNEILKKMVSSPNLASKSWVYRQYDHQVGTDTLVLPGSDAAVLRIKGTKKGVAITSDCNSRYCYLDPKRGGALAVAEAARNIVCSGGRPLAVTDCLNFGNPEDPEIMWQFVQAIEGIAEACLTFKTPVVSGNVSLYNETNGRAIYPTPTIGMVGLLDDVIHHRTQYFQQEGDVVVLLGDTKEELGGSEYLKVVHNHVAGCPPTLSYAKELAVQKTCFKAIQKDWIHSAHDCSEGGLAVALAESGMTGPGEILGAEIHLTDPLRPDALLFGESASRIVISLSEKCLPELKKVAKLNKCPMKVIGRVVPQKLVINEWIDIELESLRAHWQGTFEKEIV